jgi:glucokinase
MVQTYPSQDFKSLDDVVNAFLARPAVRERPPHAAALAIAGAVNENKCLMTNVEHWPIIDGDEIQAKHGFR